MSIKRLGLTIISCWLLAACTPQRPLPPQQLPPSNLPAAPNCAADGPGCQQFNPQKGKRTSM